MLGVSIGQAHWEQ